MCEMSLWSMLGEWSRRNSCRPVQSILMTPMSVAYCAGVVVERSNVFYFLTRHRAHTSTPSITFFGVTVFPHRLQKYGVIEPGRHDPPPPEPESRPGLK